MFMHSTIATAIADQHRRDLITRADAPAGPRRPRPSVPPAADRPGHNYDGCGGCGRRSTQTDSGGSRHRTR